MPEGKATLNLIDDKAYFVASIPESLLDNLNQGSPNLDTSKLEKRKLAFQKIFKLKSETGASGNWQNILINQPASAHQPNHHHELIVMALASFAQPPLAVEVNIDDKYKQLRKGLKIRARITANNKPVYIETKKLVPEQRRSIMFFRHKLDDLSIAKACYQYAPCEKNRLF